MAKIITMLILFSTTSLCQGEYKEDDYKSILNYPRLHFSGRYTVNAATVNNLHDNYDSETFLDHHALPNNEGGKGGWNPAGTNDFLLKDVTIKRVCYLDGSCSQNHYRDAAIGSSLQDVGFTTAAKMADIDPNAQQFTQIWGLEIKIPDLLQARSEVLTLRRFWQNMIHASPKNDTSRSGTMHGLLSDPVWGIFEKSSQIIQELKSEMQRLGSTHLSFRFVLDTFDIKKIKGRIYGSIGVQGLKSAKEFILERQLVSQKKTYQDSSFKIDKKLSRIIFEIGSSFPVDENGKLISDGDVYFVIAYPRENVDTPKNLTCGDRYNILARVPIERAGWLENEAGFVEVKLSGGTITLLENRPVVVLKVRGHESNKTCIEVIMKECTDGLCVRPMGQFLFRKESGDHLSVTFGAKKFGQPQAGLDIGLSQMKNSSKVHCCWPKFPLPNNTKTDARGLVDVNITLPMMYNPRRIIDGQIYGITYYPKNACFEKVVKRMSGDHVLIVRVFDHFKYPKTVTWTEHIYPIMKQYANLFPVMKRPSLDLGSYNSVIKFKHAISESMNLPISHTSYMPVNRDMSTRKRRMITKYLAQETPAFGDVNDLITIQYLRGLLQTAIEIEHSTLPPYLTALWSIRDGYNRQVHRLIKTVARQEMLHMGLAANLLNSIGGKPSFIHSTFLPKYPTGLPGGLQPNLIVSLEKLSPRLIRDVFMQIEKGDTNTHDRKFRKAIFGQVKALILHRYCLNKTSNAQCRSFQNMQVNKIYDPAYGCPRIVKDFLRNQPDKRDYSASPEDYGSIRDVINYKTGIASYYTHILYAIAKLTNCGQDNSIFTGDPNRQITTDYYRYGNGRLFAVTDYLSAMKAVMTIIEEGEGTSDCDPAVHYLRSSDDLSHYSMFQTIVKRRRVRMKKPIRMNVERYFNSTVEKCNANEKPYDFSGRSVHYIPSAIWPILKNAKESDYKQKSLARIHAKTFARLYNRMLGSLHKAFNGERKFFVNAKFLMYAIDYYGRLIVKTPVNAKKSPFLGPNAAPLFKWMKTEVKNLRYIKHATNDYVAYKNAAKVSAKGRVSPAKSKKPKVEMKNRKNIEKTKNGKQRIQCRAGQHCTKTKRKKAQNRRSFNKSHQYYKALNRNRQKQSDNSYVIYEEFQKRREQLLHDRFLKNRRDRYENTASDDEDDDDEDDEDDDDDEDVDDMDNTRDSIEASSDIDNRNEAPNEALSEDKEEELESKRRTEMKNESSFDDNDDR